MRHALTTVILAAALSGCGAVGQFFPDFDGSSGGSTPGVSSGMAMTRDGRMMSTPNADMLMGCRGHVLAPAMGMTFVPFGGQQPAQGQFLREESLTAPYRVLPPGSMATMDNVPSRLNVDLDGNNRIIGLRCG